MGHDCACGRENDSVLPKRQDSLSRYAIFPLRPPGEHANPRSSGLLQVVGDYVRRCPWLLRWQEGWYPARWQKLRVVYSRGPRGQR